MKIISVFDESKDTLQEIIEKFLIDYCLEIGIFKKDGAI